MIDERTLTEDQIRTEHEADVNVRAHWLYLVAVLVGGFLLMVALIGLLGGS
jgi:hypothetical protein